MSYRPSQTVNTPINCFSGCSTPLESPLLSFAPDQTPTNLFLGLEWPAIVPPGPFQTNVEAVDTGINETVLIGDRISGIHGNLIGDGILLGDEPNLDLIQDSQNEIDIDPDLLTLKPARSLRTDEC